MLSIIFKSWQKRSQVKPQHFTSHNVYLALCCLFFETVPLCIKRVRKGGGGDHITAKEENNLFHSLFVKQKRRDYNLYFPNEKASSTFQREQFHVGFFHSCVNFSILKLLEEAQRLASFRLALWPSVGKIASASSLHPHIRPCPSVFTSCQVS